VSSIEFVSSVQSRIAPQAVSALAYHKVAEIPPAAKYRCNYITPARFDAQLRYLRTAGYSSISFRDYLAYRRGDGRLPARAVLITFDDGYKSNLEIAVPILRRRGFSATFFVVAGCSVAPMCGTRTSFKNRFSPTRTCARCTRSDSRSSRTH
jgi:hypothetical protein